MRKYYALESGSTACNAEVDEVFDRVITRFTVTGKEVGVVEWITIAEAKAGEGLKNKLK